MRGHDIILNALRMHPAADALVASALSALAVLCLQRMPSVREKER
jgi:hypothetical protein